MANRLTATTVVGHPELNAIERFWLQLETRCLTHRLWPDHDAIVEAPCKARQWLTPIKKFFLVSADSKPAPQPRMAGGLGNSLRIVPTADPLGDSSKAITLLGSCAMIVVEAVPADHALAADWGTAPPSSAGVPSSVPCRHGDLSRPHRLPRLRVDLAWRSAEPTARRDVKSGRELRVVSRRRGAVPARCAGSAEPRRRRRNRPRSRRFAR